VRGGVSRLHHGRAERGFAEIHFRESAPDLHLGNVLDVLRDDDFLFVARADERLGLQFVQQINIAVRVHDLPVRIRSIGNNKVIRQGENALSILDAVRDRALVRFGALELRRRVGTLSERTRRAEREAHNRNANRLQHARHFLFPLSCF